MNIHQPAQASASEAAAMPPFDTAKLDRLMEDARLDVLLAVSKPVVQYLTGYRSFFFDVIDAIGVSRYLPIYVYAKGQAQQAAFIGCRLDNFQVANGQVRAPVLDARADTTAEAVERAVAHLRKLGVPIRRIGVETSFFPMEAHALLQAAFPKAEIVDAFLPLERLRAVKTPQELELLREASDRVINAMEATFRKITPGMSKAEVVQTLRTEETARELNFEYCLITAGTSLNRAPSEQRLASGDTISLDSGGNYHGYVGDLCRMGILGEPDAELTDYLAAIEEIQQGARKPIRPGTRGGDVVEAGRALRAASPHASYLDFTVHGMGLITHEAPRLMNDGPVPYDAYDADKPLEAGMALSIETTMHHPRRGFIKLEDTVVVTDRGAEGYGDRLRSWNRAG